MHLSGSKRARAGVTLVEVLVVALIAGTSMVFIMSLGQANVQLSTLNEESLMARQIALDIVEYYAHNLAEGKANGSSDYSFKYIFESHPALITPLQEDKDSMSLYKKMDPSVYFHMQYNVEVPEGSGNYLPGLHRMIAGVGWKEGAGANRIKWVVTQRLIAEMF